MERKENIIMIKAEAYSDCVGKYRSGGFPAPEQRTGLQQIHPMGQGCPRSYVFTDIS